MTIKNAKPFKNSVIDLLTTAKLPVEDLPAELDNFIVATDGDDVTGVAGLEILGNYGLLRSVTVDVAHHGQAIAAQLVAEIELLAEKRGLEGIYLLTETAADYFNAKGYEHIARMDIPEEIKASSQFAHVCPESAIAMKKSITG